MTTTSADSIRDKFMKGVYSLDDVPNVVAMGCKGVEVHESAPYIDVVASLEDRSSVSAGKKCYVPMPQLKASCGSDWFFGAFLLQRNYIESRDSLDEMLMSSSDRALGSECIKADKIPIREAFKAMHVTVLSDVDYCLRNRDRLETELNCKIPQDLDVGDEIAVRKVEQEVFYKSMCKIFGRESEEDQVAVDGGGVLYEKSYMLSDFNVLSFDGNYMLATAVRADYYVVFCLDY